MTAVAVVQDGGPGVVVGCVLVAVFSCCYVVTAVAGDRKATRVFWWSLGAQAVLFLAALPFARANAFFLATVVVSCLVPQLTGRAAVRVVLGAGLAAAVVPWVVPSWQSGPGWTQAVALVFTALMVYAFAEAIRRTGRWSRRARKCSGSPPRPSGPGSRATCTTCSATRSPRSP
ncbi:hypothetical protein QRX50_00420 [Amycolatopsis carbonis]|uniref:Uncharacterized protein n=1 Tax=Amycolatopsis carbonis TaxID=715471 RepID=A0A9Y2IJ73_9PSEU|nr:hypothetical protein [Amycolatopsis sp. 2-15]WIX79318.1 hypothetical protein QRX50_00420 [Amycolatopsis sp. 2-15]